MGKPYKYTLEHSFSMLTPIKGRVFKSKWLELHENGILTVSKGYSWDGCSPKFRLFGRIFGTWDGPKRGFGKPATYYASLVHDALYQYKEEIFVSRKEADCLFFEMLKDERFRFSWLYYLGVRAGGWLYGRWNA